MKQLLFVLALMSVAVCHKPDVQTIVCELWSGWGLGFAGDSCAFNIRSSCKYSFLGVEILMEFFKTLDSRHLYNAIYAFYMALYGFAVQPKACKYIEYLSHFFTHISNFFKNFKENCELIRLDIAGFIFSFNEGDYYTAGNFLGNISKIIFAS